VRLFLRFLPPSENVVYDWPAPVGEQFDGREIRSDIGRASALPCSESALLQYTEELVKQRHKGGAGADANNLEFTPEMQDEKNTFAIILLSPQLHQETRTFCPGASTSTPDEGTAAASSLSSTNWVVRVYIHPDSKYYKQFCKNPQVEEGGANEIVKLLSVDICHNARVHGIKGISETHVVTEMQETVNDTLGCVEKRVGFVITTKGSNILVRGGTCACALASACPISPFHPASCVIGCSSSPGCLRMSGGTRG
jgi:hypothetical protein